METIPEYLTVHELAELLRVKERKVYDLAASGQVPVSRATGKLLFPEREIRAWIAGGKSAPGTSTKRPDVLLGSHDPLLEWAVRQSECGLATLLDGSSDGLDRFCTHEGIAAGMHIHDAATESWNLPAVTSKAKAQDAVLLSWATRRRGIVMAAGKSNAINLLSDLKGRRVASRQPASGTAVLLDHILKAASIDKADITFTPPARSEQDAVLAVAEGDADATFGLEALAKPFGLDFLPVVEERFDLLVDRRTYFEPPFQRLLEFSRTDQFANRAKSLGGYSVKGLGSVRWSA